MTDASTQTSLGAKSGRKLLKGAAAIAQALRGSSDAKEIRWVHAQRENFGGAIFQLKEGGELYAFEDDLIALFEMRASEARSAAAAARAARAAEKEALLEDARRAVTPTKRRVTAATG